MGCHLGDDSHDANDTATPSLADALSRITTVELNEGTRLLWAKQQQSGRRPTLICHNPFKVSQGRRFFMSRWGSDGGPAILELWHQAFPYRLLGFNSPARLPAVSLRSAGNLNDPPRLVVGVGF